MPTYNLEVWIGGNLMVADSLTTIEPLSNGMRAAWIKRIMDELRERTSVYVDEEYGRGAP